ncbi:MAG: TIGR00341 family protein, partial [Dinghuibacter sp.]|nr:TIGR00341 family protein [Dinghuibacter sp.]
MKKWPVIQRFLRKQFMLEKEEHESETYAEVEEGAAFRGYNLWILGFAMIIACIGLNTDSVSAVIGAMLISPLMG